MKTRDSIKLLFLFLITIAFAACNDEVESLSFYKDSYEVAVREYAYIGIQGGNRKYTLEVDNPAILEAKVEFGSSDRHGEILLYGKKKGITNLLITDNVTQESYTMPVKVTDTYIHYTLSPNEIETTYPLKETTYSLFLVNNEEKDLYFARRVPISLTDSRIEIQGKGSYFFDEKEGKKYLTLTYASMEEGKFTEEAIEPTSHTFLITGGNDWSNYLLDTLLDLNWEIDYPKDSVYYPTVLRLEEVETGKTMAGSLTPPGLIPEGVL